MPDYTVEDTVYKRFTTRAFATGIPGTLGGTPVVAAYEDDSTTQITAGITLGVDHDSVTGLNLLTIVATGANGYEAGKSYDLVITTGTVGGVSVVGEVVWHFTLSAEAAAVDLANGTDGLGAIKAETAAILDDTDLIDDGTSGLAKIATDVAAVLVDTGTTLDGKIDTIDANVDAILVDTGTTLDGKINTIDTNVDAILVDTGTTLDGKIDTIGTNVDAVLVDTGTTLPALLPAALVGGKMDANVGAISASTTAADNLEASALGIVPSSVNDAGATITSFVSALTEATDDHYNGRIIVFTSGDVAGQATDITDYTGATKTITMTALTEAPANSVTFVIV